jgi:hypothetical protein
LAAPIPVAGRIQNGWRRQLVYLEIRQGLQPPLLPA